MTDQERVEEAMECARTVGSPAVCAEMIALPVLAKEVHRLRVLLKAAENVAMVLGQTLADYHVAMPSPESKRAMLALTAYQESQDGK